MKELSIEEKAKAYDEAFTKARNIVNSINVGLIGKDSFEAVFPELREESEDERIRKELIDYINSEYRHTLGLDRKNRFIAWLEKQGEQKPASWSEKDERWFKELELMALSFSNDDSYRKKFFDWLKSLKDRVQPKQEWSDEDELMLTSIIQTLKLTNGAAQIKIDWLKSFKNRVQPQPKWKPSDEKMSVLNEVINYAANSELQHWSNFIYTLLKSSRERLKKLMEEQL